VPVALQTVAEVSQPTVWERREECSELGVAIWDTGGKHRPENVGNKPFELVVVELKSKTAPARWSPETVRW